jgi:hypothetical protein
MGSRRINNPPQVKQPAPQASKIRRGGQRNEWTVVQFHEAQVEVQVFVAYFRINT